jgi:LPXTG-motif cell wall-anchored protein
VTLDGKPLAGSAVARLGEWRSFRPNFSALPGNLSATFQPEGDGLGSAENPLDPQVGDLRITWRELVLPPLQGQVVLRDGEWVLPGAPETAAASEDIDTIDDARTSSAMHWLLAGGLLLLLAAVLAIFRRRRAQPPGQV